MRSKKKQVRQEWLSQRAKNKNALSLIFGNQVKESELGK
jgi:hypothetical protein